jgi:hypothetical protein
MSAVKEELERMARDLPEDATWEDVQEAIYIRQGSGSGAERCGPGKSALRG